MQIIVVQRHRQFGKFFVRHTSTKLAIERIRGRLTEWKAVDFLDYLGELRKGHRVALGCYVPPWSALCSWNCRPAWNDNQIRDAGGFDEVCNR
jgi:hypothetical protein